MALTPIRNRIFPRWRFVWSSATEPKARWVGGIVGFRIRGSGARELVVCFACRGLLLWSAGAVVAAFVVGTAVAAYLLGRNPYNRITYADMVLPTHWSELPSKRGQALIDEGVGELKMRHYAAGIMLVSHGLQLHPESIPARMVLGQMFANGGYLHRALEFLRGGVPYARGQRRYLEATLNIATHLEDDEQGLAIIAEAEKSVPESDASTRRWLAERRAAALVRLGRFDDVIRLHDAAGAASSMALNAAWARALAGTGRGDAAMAAVRAAPGDFGVFGEPWELLLELAQTAHRPEVGRFAADALVAIAPTDFQLHVKRLVYLAGIEPEATVREAVDDFFLHFGANDLACTTLLKQLEPVGSAVAVRAVWQQLQARGRITIDERIACVQDLIAAGDLPGARREFDAAARLIDQGGTAFEAWETGTRVLLDLLTTGAPSAISQLEAFCNDHPLPPEAFRMLTRTLVRAGRPAAAQEIAAVARNRYPHMYGLPEPAALGAAPVPTTATTPKGNDLVTVPQAQSDLKAMDAALSAGHWDEALTLIARVEKSPLAAEHAEELLYDRILIHGQRSNQTELSWYMRRLMDRPRGFAPARLRQIAGTLHAAGRTDSALTLLREVLREHPDAKWAAELQRSWRETIKGAPLETPAGG